MKAVTFSGGIHPRYEKDRTAGLAVKPLPDSDEVVVPLSQHIGAPASACVEKGDEVLRGQAVGEPGGFVSTFIHSPVSGKVKAIEPRPGMGGAPVQSVVISSDGENREAEFEGLGTDWESADADALKELVRKGGLVGMGGAAFPTHVKLSPPKEKPIDAVILNGAECEPFLTSDHRVMLERPDDVITGLAIVQKVLGASKAIIGIEQNKPDAIEAITKAAQGKNVEVFSLEVKYPQGAEKQLIDACLGRQIPSGGLPMDVGVVVQNVGTAAAIADAVILGKPLIERIVTVTGPAIEDPSNLLIKVGTPVNKVIEACGGVKDDIGKLISGGPMMGMAQYTDEVPVTKGTSGLLFLTKDDVDVDDPGPCIRCGRCVRACPMRLPPTEIATYSAKTMIEEAEESGALDCIECGSCSFECPSHITLVQHIRLGKAAIMAAKRKKN
ncbi:MAG: electron transport complex subunit RsxC [Deltaproteobacteria bacterium]|nr:electron transport complex subunit RsxC [Deltaproteobacteria bacterium]